MERKVVIDKEKCIGCGLCKSDCVAFAIDVQDGKAVHREKGCIMCGHCEAICPVGAVTLTGYDDAIIETARLTDKRINIDENELQRIIKLTNNVANNINQIAHRANITDKVYKEDIDEIKELGNKLWQPLLYLQSKVLQLKR